MSAGMIDVAHGPERLRPRYHEWKGARHANNLISATQELTTQPRGRDTLGRAVRWVSATAVTDSMNRRLERQPSRIGLAWLALGLFACTSPVASLQIARDAGTFDGNVDAGGTKASGGASTTGGAASTGGTTGTGGVVSAGGVFSTGGISGTGGITSSGGITGTGGATPPDAGGGDATAANPEASTDTAPDGEGVDLRDVAAVPDAFVSDAPGSDASAATGLPSQASVLEAMRRANDYFTGRHADPTQDIVTEKTRPSNLWTRAIYYEGLMALHGVEPDATRKSAYYDYAVTWGASPAHPWTLTYTAAGTMTNNADHQACGQTYIDLYRIDPKPERIAVIKANIDDMVAKGTSNVWTWIDAIQMSMPVFARLGVVDSDTRYFDAMWALYNHARTKQGGGLYNAADGLWWRDLHFTPGGTQQKMTASLHGNLPGSGTDAYIVSPNGKSIYWSRGNGWVMAALVRVLDLLPASDSHRAQYVSDLQAMAVALLPIQRGDGFWNESLLDPTHCSSIGLAGQDGPETSGTALFAYGLAWGIRKGVLDKPTYAPALASAWNGLATVALQSNGLLGYVQSTGDRPCTDSAALGPTKLANFDDYGVGAFLLAGSEVYQLAH
jgi:unsaturated rhamnogalacturonyl hydrolase